MADTTLNPDVKRETVYSGPAPSTVKTNSGTVYGGPGAGTVYNGPGSNGTVYGSPGTVYSPRQQSTPRPAAGMHAGSAKGAGIFFLIAGFSVVNTLLILASSPFVLALGLAVTRISPRAPMPAIVVLNVIAVGLFVLLGIFVRQGSKAALLIGMLLYAGDTALLLLGGNPAAHVPSIIVHVIFLFSMFKAFGQFES